MSFLSHTLASPLRAEPHTISLQDGTRLEFLETGFLRLRPATAGTHRVLISCGIHGNETAPMEIVDGLFDEIRNGQLKVINDVLFVIGNPPAANRAERFIEENLNRLFSGKHRASSSAESDRAELIEHFTEAFFTEGSEPRLHYDLHTAIRGSEFEKFAVYPYLQERRWSSSQLGFLEHCGIEAVLLSHQPSGTYSYFTSSKFSADAFTVELGKVRKFGENDMSNFTAIRQGLRRLISGQEDFNAVPDQLLTFEVVEEVIKRSDAFNLHIAPDAKNFTAFDPGTLLASDEDYEYRTERDGERFVFPISNVPIGQRAMLVIAPTKLSFNEH